MHASSLPPALDTEFSDACFGAPAEGERELIKKMWASLQKDTPGEIARLGAWPAGGGAEALRRELHRVRGYFSVYGFARGAAILSEWEKHPAPIEAGPAQARETLAAFEEGMAAARRRYPWLAD